MLVFSRSQRDRGQADLPPTLRGKSAIPLFAAAGPLSWVVWNTRKSVVCNRWGTTVLPSKAV